ncbi:MAG: hypothetical protein KHZ93_04090 [Clostridiales bacterium]|nr:hypothetical protein [Clostridiales bacterium]
MNFQYGLVSVCHCRDRIGFVLRLEKQAMVRDTDGLNRGKGQLKLGPFEYSASLHTGFIYRYIRRLALPNRQNSDNGKGNQQGAKEIGKRFVASAAYRAKGRRIVQAIDSEEIEKGKADSEDGQTHNLHFFCRDNQIAFVHSLVPLRLVL